MDHLEELVQKTINTVRNLKEYGIEKGKETLKEHYSSRPIKPVLQYDLSGNFIKEWAEGPSYILRETWIEVARCCRGIMKTSKGFWWSKSEHIKKLKDPDLFWPSTDFKKWRIVPEMWVCQIEDSKYHCAWQSNVNHYSQRYTKDNYI